MGGFVFGLFMLAAVPLAMLTAIVVLWVRVGALQDRVRMLERGEEAPVPMRAPAVASMATPPPARVITDASPLDDDPSATQPDHEPEPQPEPDADPFPYGDEPMLPTDPYPAPAPAFAGFESLIGGRLPVWIGGAALVLAGFFLVRYSIDAGLLGPGVRVVLAALFALLLVGGAEVARRSRLVADDPRIAQALAGAGIASAYGTLYMAGELYGLIGAGAAFALMLAITAAALGLSLRHGPPTAVMGLIGGFAAPLVTGYDDRNLVPLLVYLSVFVGALFGLAVARGWIWLAGAAAIAGFAWSLALIVLIDGPAAQAIGAFVLLLAIGGAFVALRIPGMTAPLATAPLAIGLILLLVLAPRIDFGLLIWPLYGLLAGAAIVLAARDPRMRIAAPLALAATLGLLALGVQYGAASAPAAAVAYTLLFAGSGHWLAHRNRATPLWEAIALIGSAGPWAIVWLGENVQPPPFLMLFTAMAMAGSAALVAMRTRHPHLAITASVVAFLLVVAGLSEVIASQWLPAIAAMGVVALGLWERRQPLASGAATTIGWFVALLLTGPVIEDYLAVLVTSLFGEQTPYSELPLIFDGLRALVPPIVAAGLMMRIDPNGFGISRPLVLGLASTAAGAIAYHLLKLPLAIDTPARFVSFGFTERAVLTHLLFAVALVAARREGWQRVAQGAAALALARIVWFDLLALNPLVVTQAVGALPVLNAATLHAAGSAIWLWLLARALPPRRLWRGAALASALVAALVLVRQASHGTLLTGEAGQGETWLYSTAMLALAIGWLWRGIVTGARDLRLAGLALSTVTTVKVFVIDAAALDGLLRILGFLGLGIALIAIGWVYNRVLRAPAG